MSDTKTILITGTSRGIGLLAASSLAQNGHRVYALMRNLEDKNQSVVAKFNSLSAKANGEIIPLELDVTNEEQCKSVINTIASHGNIDALINNAGQMPVGVTEAFSNAQIRECFDVNFHGLINTTNTVLPFMRQLGHGRLIHMSSSAGRVALPFFGVYCASKWAVEAYAESVHYEVESFGIESCIVEPSGHATDLVNTAPRPNNIDRQNQYQHLAKGGDRMLQMFEQSFAKQEPETDAQNVADCLVTLVEQTDKLPLRCQIGSDMGVERINEVVAPVQNQLINQLAPIYAGG